MVSRMRTTLRLIREHQHGAEQRQSYLRSDSSREIRLVRGAAQHQSQLRTRRRHLVHVKQRCSRDGLWNVEEYDHELRFIE